MSSNQQGLYAAEDSVAGSWMHSNKVTGSGYWNFGSNEHTDTVEIIGSLGRIHFSVFKQEPIVLVTKDGTRTLMIENPKHIQHFHVENIKKHLFGHIEHPSSGMTAAKTNWVMEQILRNKGE